MLSLSLRSGVKVEEAIDQLKGIQCPACTRVKAKGEKLDGLSCADVIGRVLEEEYMDSCQHSCKNCKQDKLDKADRVDKENSEKPSIKKEKTDKDSTQKCPECGSNLRFEGGCCICSNCSYSRCG